MQAGRVPGVNRNKLLRFIIRHRWRLVLAAGMLGIVAAFFGLGLDRYLSFDAIRRQEASLVHVYALHPAQWALAYFTTYVAITGLSLPLAVPITLLAGPVFGLLWGSVIVSFAAAIGASLAFLAARFLFRDWVQRRFERQLAAINRGIERDGIFYLFFLRLIPAFPFFVINLAMGLTPMRLRTYFWVTFFGMIPGNVLYVNAGVQLGNIHSMHDLLSPALIGSFVALGLFPLLVKKLVDVWRKRHNRGRESEAGKTE